MPAPYRLSTPQLDDPYPYYRELRDEDPAHYSPVEDLFVLTRFDDCLAVFSDFQMWSSERRGNLINDPPERIGRSAGLSERISGRASISPRLVPDARTLIRTSPEPGDGIAISRNSKMPPLREMPARNSPSTRSWKA